MHPGNCLSRRALLRGLTSSAAVIALGGCASLALTGDRFDAAEIKVNPTLLVATTRKPVNGARSKPWFGTERASRMTAARAALTPPNGGRFSLASVGLADWRLDAIETVPQVADLFGQTTGARDVLVYVHGFNQTFEMAALDAARLADGIRFRGETMVFSWPSKAKLFDYGYDRESAMWSRDALEQVLERLVLNPNVGRVHIVAHSIGTMLAMELLRQLYGRHGSAAGQRIGAVVFAAPDIDMDVSPRRSNASARLLPELRSLPRPTTARWRSRGGSRAGSPASAQPRRPGSSNWDCG